MKTNCQDGNSQPTNTVHDSDASRGQWNCDRGQAKKPSKKQLLAEQRRRQKVVAFSYFSLLKIADSTNLLFV